MDQFNPDESQILAGAITLKEHPVYWKYVDAGTHGPLIEYPLVFAAWLGTPLNFLSARLIGIVLQALTLVGLWRTLRQLTSERLARLAILPGLTFWALVTWLDYLHYGTELPGNLCLALAAWSVARPLCVPREGASLILRLTAGGFLLGLIPMTKLQQVPLGLGLAVWIMFILIRQRRQPGFRQGLVAFLVGAALPQFILWAYLWLFGLGRQFHISYILSALHYSNGGQHPLQEMPSWFFHFSATAFGFAWFFWGMMAFVLLYARTASAGPMRNLCLAAWGMLGLAMYCVLRPGREVAHYLHILVPPLTFLGGAILAGCTGSRTEARWPDFRLLTTFIVLTLLPQIHFHALNHNPYVGNLAKYLSLPCSPAADYLLQHRKPGDNLVVWGWMPQLYVETGMIQGTRESATPYQVFEGPLQDFYRQRFLRDLHQRQPAWFVDAVGPGSFVFTDRIAYAHESVPALQQLIAEHYTLATEVGALRIYHLNSPSPR